jgi:hypothetical protein
MIILISWALCGECIFVLIGYLVRPWRTLAIITGVTWVSLCIPFVFYVESPKFLLGQRRMKEFGEVLKYIANINGEKLGDKFDEFIAVQTLAI